MAMDTDSIQISMADRRILAAALNSLERDLSKIGRTGPIRQNLDRLRQSISDVVPSIKVPPHVEILHAEHLGLMTLLPVSDSWRLYWTPGEGYSENSHALIAELTVGEKDWRFDVAWNLHGTGRFLELESADQDFCRLVEEHMRREAGNSAQIIHEVVDIPVPWDFLPDEEPDDRVEKYLENLQDGAPCVPAIHSVLVDVHSEIDLQSQGLASFMTEFSGFQDEIDHLRSLVERHLEEIRKSVEHKM